MEIYSGDIYLKLNNYQRQKYYFKPHPTNAVGGRTISPQRWQ